MTLNIQLARWDITHFCNLNCLHCGAALKLQTKNYASTIHDTKVIVDKIAFLVASVA